MNQIWTFLIGCTIAYVHALHSCSSDKECRRLINVEEECDITTTCQNGDCAFSATPSCEKSKDVLERRIERVEKMTEESKFTREGVETDSYEAKMEGLPAFWTNAYRCTFGEYPDNARQEIGNILAKAMKDIHRIIEPVVDTEFTTWEKSYYTDGTRATSSPHHGTMMFRDGGVPMFDSFEDAYERFIQITDPHRLCYLERHN